MKFPSLPAKSESKKYKPEFLSFSPWRSLKANETLSLTAGDCETLIGSFTDTTVHWETGETVEKAWIGKDWRSDPEHNCVNVQESVCYALIVSDP